MSKEHLGGWHNFDWFAREYNQMSITKILYARRLNVLCIACLPAILNCSTGDWIQKVQHLWQSTHNFVQSSLLTVIAKGFVAPWKETQSNICYESVSLAHKDHILQVNEKHLKWKNAQAYKYNLVAHFLL